jgi:hypothetical protein
MENKSVIKADSSSKNINLPSDKEKKPSERNSIKDVKEIKTEIKEPKEVKEIPNNQIITQPQPVTTPKNNQIISRESEELKELRNKEKLNLDKIKELQDLLEKEKELNRYIQISQQNYQKNLEEKNKELKEKEKALQTVGQTNSKLMQNLEELRREVDTHFDKVSVKQVNEKLKKSENKKDPLEIVVKVKEKELKNANTMIEILRKDNENLHKNLENYSDFKHILELQDKLKVKEKENQDLLTEIKLLNRSLEEHKKCQNVKKDLENEIKILKDDCKAVKDSLKLQQSKMKDEDKSHQKIVDHMISLKKELDKMKENSKGSSNNLINQPDRKKVNKLNHDPNLANILQTDKLNQSLENSNTNNISLLGNKNSVLLRKEKTANSVSKNRMSYKFIQNEEREKLFSPEEKILLEKVLSKSDIEKIEKKFETLDHARFSITNKHKSDLKLLTKKINESQERLEFLNSQLKESESRNKINSLQVNEYKNEQKAYQRKLNEMQNQVESLYNVIREKDQENKILVNQLNSMRRLVKHNAVPPMDSEVARHIEKIKNENESANNSFQNEVVESNLTNQKSPSSGLFITGDENTMEDEEEKRPYQNYEESEV